ADDRRRFRVLPILAVGFAAESMKHLLREFLFCRLQGEQDAMISAIASDAGRAKKTSVVRQRQSGQRKAAIGATLDRAEAVNARIAPMAVHGRELESRSTVCVSA